MIQEDMMTNIAVDDTVATESIAPSPSPYDQPEQMSLEVITLLISRLAQLMAQEVDLLDEMNITALGSLQEEKKALIDALEKQKRLMTRRQRLVDTATDEEYEQLQELVTVFNAVMEENHKRLLVAREVNNRVVQAITEMANEHAKHSYYTHTGERADDPSVSLSLNRSI
ncbi:MAG: hypothetical protein F6K62_10385 [Sphaerospermopsis sp. SIO1G2]|nr:hypothetical protein [Sphaerospermopsis sp. SIO1G2]